MDKNPEFSRFLVEEHLLPLVCNEGALVLGLKLILP